MVSNAVLGVAGFYRGTTTARLRPPTFSGDDAWCCPPGQTGIDASKMMVTGSQLPKQLFAGGNRADPPRWQLGVSASHSRLDFGITLTDVNNRSAFSNGAAGTRGAAPTNAADYPDEVWQRDTVRQ
jgi:hypothetical protein